MSKTETSNGRMSMRDVSMGIAMVAIVAFFALHPKGSQFLSPQNLSNLSIELSITATLALGMLLILLPGMIDLSVGSGVGMLGGIAAVLVISPSYVLGVDVAGWPAWLALLAALGVALGIWYLMGRLIAYQKVPAFIITLGGLLVFQGLHWLVIRNSTIPVAPGGEENLFSRLTTYYFPAWSGYLLLVLVSAGLARSVVVDRRHRRQYGFPLEDGLTAFLKLFVAIQALSLLVIVMNLHKGVPLSLVILGGVAWVVQVITRHTRFGRYLYAIGGNEEAARLSGIPVEKVIVGAFVLLGAITALTGFMQTAYGGYSTTTVGKLMELDAIAACVIGGTSLKGGRGTVLGVLFGALIMATLLNGMTLLAVTPEMKLIARGLVLVLAVWLDVVLARRQQARG
jgi:D-xylose transport system permease protein